MRSWSPQKFLNLKQVFGTSMSTCSVELDVGPAFMKAMNSGIHPHGLAAELICYELAKQTDLPVPEFALIELSESEVRSLGTRPVFASGPAFVTRAVRRLAWDGTSVQLRRLVNPEVLSMLVVFDTWVRNDDRYPPIDLKGVPVGTWSLNRDNVFLSSEGLHRQALQVLGLDFGRALTQGREFTERRFGITSTKEEAIYGLFPEFRPFLSQPVVVDTLRRIQGLGRGDLDAVVARVPAAWGFGADHRVMTTEFLASRGAFLYENMESWLFPRPMEQLDLPFSP